VILRDFDDDLLDEHLALLRTAAEEVVGSDPRTALDFQVHRQYSNMRRYLDAVPEVMEAAEEAIRAEGIEPLRIPIRGGTDGSLLSEMGMPTANLFTGGHEYHSVREWSSVQDMAAAAAVVVRLAEVWARRDPAGGRLPAARTLRFTAQCPRSPPPWLRWTARSCSLRRLASRPPTRACCAGMGFLR
jgi:hypothetical protein